MKDPGYSPDIDALEEYIENPLFREFFEFMDREYGAQWKFGFSRDSLAPGWNLKFRKAGRALCVLYPARGRFTLLVVIGRKEKPGLELLLPRLPEELRQIYLQAKEGNGQRWLMIELKNEGALYRGALELIALRRTVRRG